MTESRNELKEWTLLADEFTLLPSMIDKGRIGFAIQLKCIDEIGLTQAVFQDIPAKFIDQFCQRCATESIRELT